MHFITIHFAIGVISPTASPLLQFLGRPKRPIILELSDPLLAGIDFEAQTFQWAVIFGLGAHSIERSCSRLTLLYKYIKSL